MKESVKKNKIQMLSLMGGIFFILLGNNVFFLNQLSHTLTFIIFGLFLFTLSIFNHTEAEKNYNGITSGNYGLISIILLLIIAAGGYKYSPLFLTFAIFATLKMLLFKKSSLFQGLQINLVALLVYIFISNLETETIDTTYLRTFLFPKKFPMVDSSSPEKLLITVFLLMIIISAIFLLKQLILKNKQLRAVVSHKNSKGPFSLIIRLVCAILSFTLLSLCGITIVNLFNYHRKDQKDIIDYGIEFLFIMIYSQIILISINIIDIKIVFSFNFIASYLTLILNHKRNKNIYAENSRSMF